MARDEFSIQQVVAQLRGADGAPPALPQRSTFEWVLWENVAYLVNDEVRADVFHALERQVGLSPAAIRKTRIDALADVIREGGMGPLQRAEKLHRAATIAEEIGLAALAELMRTRPQQARAALKKFPGIGDPGADKLLLFAGCAPSIAPDSNALRVLVRLGFAVDVAVAVPMKDQSYAQTYKQAQVAVERDLAACAPPEASWFVEAHQLLRRHGQQRCRRTQPQCEGCCLVAHCPFPGSVRAA